MSGSDLLNSDYVVVFYGKTEVEVFNQWIEYKYSIIIKIYYRKPRCYKVSYSGKISKFIIKKTNKSNHLDFIQIFYTHALHKPIS